MQMGYQESVRKDKSGAWNVQTQDQLEDANG